MVTATSPTEKRCAICHAISARLICYTGGCSRYLCAKHLRVRLPYQLMCSPCDVGTLEVRGEASGHKALQTSIRVGQVLATEDLPVTEDTTLHDLSQREKATQGDCSTYRSREEQEWLELPLHQKIEKERRTLEEADGRERARLPMRSRCCPCPLCGMACSVSHDNGFDEWKCSHSITQPMGMHEWTREQPAWSKTKTEDVEDTSLSATSSQALPIDDAAPPSYATQIEKQTVDSVAMLGAFLQYRKKHAQVSLEHLEGEARGQ